MPELKPRFCQWCETNRASGIFTVYYTKRPAKILLLCADCGFNKLYAHLAMVVPKDGDPWFYHDVERVDLLKSLTTDFVLPQPKELPPATGVIEITRYVSKPTRPLRTNFINSPNYDPNPDWLK